MAGCDAVSLAAPSQTSAAAAAAIEEQNGSHSWAAAAIAADVSTPGLWVVVARVAQLEEEVRELKAQQAVLKAQADHEQDVLTRADMRWKHLGDQMETRVTTLEVRMNCVLKALQDMRAVPGG